MNLSSFGCKGVVADFIALFCGSSIEVESYLGMFLSVQHILKLMVMGARLKPIMVGGVHKNSMFFRRVVYVIFFYISRTKDGIIVVSLTMFPIDVGILENIMCVVLFSPKNKVKGALQNLIVSSCGSLLKPTFMVEGSCKNPWFFYVFMDRMDVGSFQGPNLVNLCFWLGSGFGLGGLENLVQVKGAWKNPDFWLRVLVKSPFFFLRSIRRFRSTIIAILVFIVLLLCFVGSCLVLVARIVASCATRVVPSCLTMALLLFSLVVSVCSVPLLVLDP